MPLTPEIQQAAEDLGKHLGADPRVQAWAALALKTRQDPALLELEDQLGRLYQKLVEREQNGEILEQAEIDRYHDLKRQVRDHPANVARDTQLEIVKAFFAQTAERMTAVLGIEYPTFAG
jgi:hypothetical protein